VFSLSIYNAFKARWMAAVMLCSSACHGQPLAGWIGHGVPWCDGHELALPRLAAAAGTAWTKHSWHPGEKATPNVWSKAGWILARYALSSYWTDFKPGIKRVTRRLFRRREDVLPVRAQPPPAEMAGEAWR
jgi:hypothetical protein